MWATDGIYIYIYIYIYISKGETGLVREELLGG